MNHTMNALSALLQRNEGEAKTDDYTGEDTFGLDVRFDEHTFTFFIADAATNTVVAPPPMNIPTVEAWLDDYEKEEAEE